LYNGEVEGPVHGALRLPVPQPPPPPTVFALAPFVELVLSQQHNRSSAQPYRLVFKDWLRDRFLIAELVRQCLKLF
jgi:hypothetical protein